jgi:hypothetical protein
MKLLEVLRPKRNNLTLFIFFTGALIKEVAEILPEMTAHMDVVGLRNSDSQNGWAFVALKPATYKFPSSDSIRADGATLSYVAPHDAGCFACGPGTLNDLLPLFPGFTADDLVHGAERPTHEQFAGLVNLLLSLNDHQKRGK